MTEYFTVKRIDNSRLVARGARPYARVRAPGRNGRPAGAVALLYAWQHFEAFKCARISNRLSRIARKRSNSSGIELEVASLRDRPHRPNRAHQLA